MAKITVKTLSEELDLYFSENSENMERVRMLKAWPAVAGPQLSATTSLVSTTGGVLRVSVQSSSAKTLLLMRKEQIVREFNKIFPEAKINKIQIVKRG